MTNDELAGKVDASSAEVAKMRASLVDFLDANVTRVMDLFRAWDTDADGQVATLSTH